MRHAFVHFDLNTSDFTGVRRFYEALFDWTFDDVGVQGGVPQAAITLPSGPSGGLQPTHSRGARSQWVPYVAVDDLRAMLARVREAGGAVVQDYVEVPGVGAQAIVQDPGGTQLGLLEMAAELARARTVEEVVEPEVIQDAEIIEDETGPAVVVDTPAVIEVTVAPKQKRGGRRRAAPVEAVEAVEAEVIEAEAIEAEAVPVQEIVEEEAPRAPKSSKRGAKKGKAEAPAPTKAEAEEPVAKKKGAKKSAAAEEPVAKKRAKKAAVEEPVAKKAAAEEPAERKTSKKAAAEPVTKKSAKKAAAEEPAAKKISKKAAAEEPAAKKISKKAAAAEPIAKKASKKAPADSAAKAPTEEPSAPASKKASKKAPADFSSAKPSTKAKQPAAAPAAKKTAKKPGRGRR